MQQRLAAGLEPRERPVAPVIAGLAAAIAPLGTPTNHMTKVAASMLKPPLLSLSPLFAIFGRLPET